MAGQISRMTQGRFDRAPVPAPDSYVTVDTPDLPDDGSYVTASPPPMFMGPIGLGSPRTGRTDKQKREASAAEDASSKSFIGKLKRTGNILADMTGVNAWKRLMDASLYDLTASRDADRVGQLGTDALQVAGTAQTGSLPFERPANSVSMGGRPKAEGGQISGIRAYHGSPHDFDSFDLGKIGTGEGAQAYGHGLYFADSEGVAHSYRAGLAGDYKTTPEVMKAFRNLGNLGYDTPHEAAKGVFQTPDWQKAWDVPDSPDAQVINEWLRGRPGKMYEVNIDADPNAFLDWDKPLSEQTPEVQAALRKKYGSYYDKMFGPGSTGADVGQRVEGPQYGSELAQAGIPGIKYLDAGSRGAGDGTRNYVVFDDKLISIVRKYGIAGASAMLGYNLLANADKAQAATLAQADKDHRTAQFLAEGGI